MSSFSDKFNELIEDKNTDIEKISKFLGLNNNTKVYAWLKGNNTPRFKTIVMLADYFTCSLDYLLSRTENFKTIKPKVLPEFNIHLKKVLKECKCSQYKLLKDNVVSKGHLNSWFNKKIVPSTENIIKLADYLNVSIDYLVGRE